MDGNISDTPPIVVVPRAEDRARWERLNRETEEARNRMERARREESGGFRKWLKSDARRSLTTPLDAASELLALELASEVKAKQAGAKQERAVARRNHRR